MNSAFSILFLPYCLYQLVTHFWTSPPGQIFKYFPPPWPNSFLLLCLRTGQIFSSHPSPFFVSSGLNISLLPIFSSFSRSFFFSSKDQIFSFLRYILWLLLDICTVYPWSFSKHITFLDQFGLVSNINVVIYKGKTENIITISFIIVWYFFNIVLNYWIHISLNALDLQTAEAWKTAFHSQKFLSR